MERCPNCGSLMNCGQGETCPECDHTNDDECECAACAEERREEEYACRENGEE